MSKIDELKSAIALLEDQDIEQVKKALAVIGEPVAEPTGVASTGELPFEPGKTYLVRTITYFTHGKLKAVQGGFLIFENASCVFDIGKLDSALKSGTWSESEYVGTAIVAVSSLVDAFPMESK